MKVSAYVTNYKEKEGNDNPKCRVEVSSRKEQYDIMEWHMQDLKSAQNTLFLILGGDHMVVNFTVIHHTLYTWYNYSFVSIQFLKKTIKNKSRTGIS